VGAAKPMIDGAKSPDGIRVGAYIIDWPLTL
jgi:hypothetical protein